jgi:predicted transcriptional regulator
MGRESMIRSMEKCLTDGGYRVSMASGCFDLLARKDHSIALKVLLNVDSFTHSEADDLKAISYFLDTFPFLVGERANRYGLEESIVYERFGIAAMSPFTFTRFLRGIMPSVKSRRGGYSARADRHAMKKAMDSAGMSVLDLSLSSGVSRKTLYKCMKGGSIDVGTREEIEHAMGVPVSGDLNVERFYGCLRRKPRSRFKQALSSHLERMGFAFSFLSRSPFNLVMRERESLVSVASRDKKRLVSHAGVLEELERGFELNPVFITAHGHEKSMEGIPVLSLREVKCMHSCREFMESVEERRC